MMNGKPRGRIGRVSLIFLLLGLGLWLSLALFGTKNWLLITFGIPGPAQVGIIAMICGAITCLPPTKGWLLRRLESLRSLSGRSTAGCSVVAGVVSSLYLWLTAIQEHRQFFPYLHDEFSYLIQAHQLARGRLWMPAHPLCAFFDSFQLLVKPVYASAYFPGTAMLYVPGIWLHVPPVVTSLIIAGAVAGLLFWVIAMLIDAVAAAVAVLLLWSDGMYRELSLLTMGQLPLLLFGLLAIVAWLRWQASGDEYSSSAGYESENAKTRRHENAQRNSAATKKNLNRKDAETRRRNLVRKTRNREISTKQGSSNSLNSLRSFLLRVFVSSRLRARFFVIRWQLHTRGSRWTLLTGFFLGMACITRPVDALCFVIPIGIAVAIRNWRQLWMIFIGALPLICLQLVLNHGVTGRWLQTPFAMYADRDYPGTNYGFHPYDPAAKPDSDLPQKIALYENDYRPVVMRHRPENILADLLHPHGVFNGARLGWTLSQCTPEPFPLLLICLPLSLLAMTKQRAVLLVTLPLFVGLYIPYVFFFPHYVVTAAPAVIVGSLMAAKAMAGSWRAQKSSIDSGLTLFLAAVAIASLPQWGSSSEDLFKADLLALVNGQLASLPHRPAVVLFTYDPKRNTHEEPVYNAHVAWPDDADVVRAHDRGALNQAIFDYYARRQPDRTFYRFDERDRTLHALGTARQLGHLRS